MTNDTEGLKPRRTAVSFWPFILLLLPIITVYTLGHWDRGSLCGRDFNEHIALPLVFLSILGYGAMALRYLNEFLLVMFILSVDFFCREWHFAGTTYGVYMVAAILGCWVLYRRKTIASLIKNTPVEIWLWATAACYLFSVLISRRVFGDGHLGLLPNENLYHIPLEESTETMAHLMLALTCLIAWRQFGKSKAETYKKGI
jgi:hypothetical protein